MNPPPVQIESAKSVDSMMEWANLTVRSGEEYTARYHTNEFSAMIARATAWVYIFADMNAGTCAGQRLRMYRPKGKRSRKGMGENRTRAVDKRAMKHLTAPSSVGAKAADYADYAGDVEEVLDHPALMLLRRPNPFYKGTDFFRLRHWYKEVCGNDFQMVVADASDYPNQLWPMMPQYTRIVPDRINFIAGYSYGREESRREFFDTDDVIHSKFSQSPFSPYNGIGPLYAVLAEADLDSAATESEKATWLNGARPDFVAALPAGATAEQVAQYTAKVNAGHRGPKNKGRFLVTTEAKIEPLSWSMREMEYIAGKENILTRIAAAFGVPESRYKMNDSNLASSKTGDLQYMRDTIRPRCNQDAEEWTESLLPLFGEEPGEMWFAYDNCVPADEAATVARNVAYVNAGIITPNEARVEEGLEPVTDDPAAEMLRSPVQPLAIDTTQEDGPKNDTTMGEAAGNPASDVQATALNGAQVTALIDILAQAASQMIPLESVGPIISAAFPLLAPEQVSAIVDPLRAFEPKAPEPTAQQIAAAQPSEDAIKSIVEATIKAWSTKDDKPKQLTNEEQLRADVEAMLNRAAGDIAHRIALDPSRSILETVKGVGFDRMMIDAVSPTVTKLFTNGWDKGYADVASRIGGPDDAGVSLGFDIASPDANRFLDAYKFRLADSTSRTVAGSLETVVQEQIATGTTIPQMTNALLEKMNGATPHMAERIARTESSRAFNTGRESAWTKSGIVEGKEWLLGGEPCPICTAMSEKHNNAALGADFIPLGGTIQYTEDGVAKTFTAEYEAVDSPPVHPNCTCSMGAVFKEIEQ